MRLGAAGGLASRDLGATGSRPGDSSSRAINVPSAGVSSGISRLLRYLTAAHGQLPAQVSTTTTGEYVACKQGISHTRYSAEATSPHTRQQGPTPAHRASWDDGQTPSGAASSGRRGKDPTACEGSDAYEDMAASACAVLRSADAFQCSSVMELAVRSASVNSRAARSRSVAASFAPFSPAVSVGGQPGLSRAGRSFARSPVTGEPYGLPLCLPRVPERSKHLPVPAARGRPLTVPSIRPFQRLRVKAPASQGPGARTYGRCKGNERDDDHDGGQPGG